MTERERRLLAVMSNGKDAERTVALLANEGIQCVSCDDLPRACEEIRAGAGALLIAEEMLHRDRTRELEEVLAAQPTWSMLPVIVLGRGDGDERVGDMIRAAKAQVTLVERPVRTRTLVSVVRAALRSRQNQYEIRDAIVERERQARLLKSQAEQLRDAARRKDEFLATLAHELRNPLAPVRMGLTVLSRGPNEELARRTLARMERQLAHMVRLIDDLMDVSRITSGKVVLRREPTTLRDVIDTAVDANRALLDAAGHELSVSMPEGDIVVDADPTRLAQVVGNLLNNAIKYTPRGGRIALSVRQEGARAVIQVVDNGLGIPVEKLEVVFDMFSQVNRTLDRAQGGLGIGLALVRELLALHDGTVSAHSDGLGHGSTFTVSLPVAERRTALEGASETPPLQHARRVLVVDDNVDAAEALSELLQALGHRTCIAHAGSQALELAATFHPEVVFLDIGLPGMDGYEVARRLRGDPELREAKLVAVTGWGTAEDKNRAMRAGFDLHLTKPVEAKAIDRALSDLA